MHQAPPKHDPLWRVVLAFTTVYIVWGSTYFFIQVAVKEIPPMMLGALRFLASGAILLGWCVARGEGSGSREQVKTAAITGMMLLFMGTGAVIWAEQWLPSSLVAILISSSPFWFVLLDFPMWKENLRNRSVIAGLVFGFAGVNLMFADKMGSAFTRAGDPLELVGLGILLVGTVSWAGGSLYARYRAKGSATLTSAWQMLVAGIAFMAWSLLLGEWKDVRWHAISASAWLSVAYLVVFGSLIAYSAYVWLLRVRPPAQVSTYAYVNPLIAVLLGVVLGGEHLTLFQGLGLAVILGSVLLINLARYRS